MTASVAGWARVAKGLQLVTSSGASRITTSVLSSNVATKHLPELAESIIKAGGTHTVAAQEYYMKDYIKAADSVDNVGGTKSRDGQDNTISTLSYATQHTHTPYASSSKHHHHDTSGGLQISNIEQQQGDSSEELINQSLNNREMELPSSIQNIADDTDKDAVLHTSESQSSSTTTGANDNIRMATETAEIYDDEHQAQHLPEGSAIPSGRISRAFGFATLGAGLAMGTISELAKRTIGQSSSSSNSVGPLVLSNDANAQRLSDSLRRMRGAAMKLGQMLSIQDESIAPPALTNALAQVRRSAEAMPQHQLMQQLEDQWGKNWRDKIELEERPFAAASIGQVHRGRLAHDDDDDDTTMANVAVKVQYPGVADSIESDLSNLTMLVKATGLSPPGLFLDNVIRVGREELKVECDYQREVANQKRFQTLVSSDPALVAGGIVVPKVFDELSTSRIIVTELVKGGTIDKVVDLDQDERNRIGRSIMRLTMLELFVWRFMQTDPNWGNFLYDVRTRKTYLIDFGAAREFDEEFVRGYLNIVIANANQDEKALMEESIRMGFLTGDENDIMMEAHKLSGFCLGEPFQSYEPYDFKSSKITSRISEHGAVFLKHRLTPPPEEVYTLHRKLAGAYNLCIKLGAKISCRDLLDEVQEYHDV